MIALRLITIAVTLCTGTVALADRESRDTREEREYWSDAGNNGEEVYLCEACRNLEDFPHDGANFSMNQVWGPDSWMTVEQADRFLITDRFGTVMRVDLNLDLGIYWVPVPGFSFRMFSGVIPWPDDLKLQVLMRDRYNRLVYRDVVRPHMTEWPLRVGGEDTTQTIQGDSGGDDESEDEDEHFGNREFGEDWGEADLGGEECQSCTAIFDSDMDGYLDRDRNGEFIEYEL